LFWLGFYKYAAPDCAGVGTLRGDVPAGAFLFLANGIFEGTGKRGQADGAARHPYHAGRAHGGYLQRLAVCKDPAKGGLGWTNGAKGVARENPKGISSFSPALPDAIGLRRVTERE
jgi:hypothetical protein